MPSLATLKAIFTFAPWVAILLILGWAARVNDLRDRWHHQYEAEHAGRLADRAAYEAAQAKAAVDNQAHVQKVEQHYKKESDDERQSYLSDLARLRAERMQQGDHPLERPPSSAGPSAPSAPGTGANGAGLQVHPAPDVQAPTYGDAAEIELRLMHLQNYVERMLAIDPNAVDVRR
jgi:hypothetical protein